MVESIKHHQGVSVTVHSIHRRYIYCPLVIEANPGIILSTLKNDCTLRGEIRMVDARIAFKAPADCTPDERTSFFDLVVAGGEVKPIHARAGIARAEKLAFAHIQGALAGVGCLKNPRLSYKQRVFEKSRSELNPDDFAFEGGYVVVDRKFRGNGLSTKITATLIEGMSSKLFATSHIENTKMHAALARSGFTREGDAYRSVDEPEKMLFLFVKT